MFSFFFTDLVWVFPPRHLTFPTKLSIYHYFAKLKKKHMLNGIESFHKEIWLRDGLEYVRAGRRRIRWSVSISTVTSQYLVVYVDFLIKNWLKWSDLFLTFLNKCVAKPNGIYFLLKNDRKRRCWCPGNAYVSGRASI